MTLAHQCRGQITQDIEAGIVLRSATRLVPQSDGPIFLSRLQKPP